jgi:hypothetical protein
MHEAAGENIELVGAVDVTMQGGREELGEDEDAGDAGVDAVADGDINKTVFAGEGHSRLGPQFGQRIQAGSPPAAEHNGQYVLKWHCLPPSGFLG